MKRKLEIFGIFVLLMGFLMAGCTQPSGDTPADTSSIEGDATADKGTIKLGLPPWPGVTVKSQVAKIVLEDMGYEVETNELDVGIVYGEMAAGNIDALLAGWLPVTHGAYIEEHGDKLEQVHINVPATWLGLAVPTYVYEAGVTSIPDLAQNKEKFDGRIVGIEPGAGIMQSTEDAIEAYGLEGYTLQDSSTPAMMAEADAAIKNDEWVVFTIWEPHSAFARFDIAKLEDPEEIYGGGDVVYTVTRKDFKDDYPEAYAFFQKFEVSPDDQSLWILEYSDKGRDPTEVAQEWIENNPEKVAEWTS